MIDMFNCPICGDSSWERLRERYYLKAEIPNLKPHLQQRYRILFEAWFAGREEVKIASVLCGSCGLIVLTPRPTESDIDRKYEIDVSSRRVTWPRKQEDISDRRRAAGIYQDVYRYVPPLSTVLDYGGDDGRLILPFLEKGHHCYVVDYAKDTVPGVVHLGSTLKDLEPTRQFDLVILSHVLEHVAEPLGLLLALREHHAPGGTLYVEVPMELWGRTPPGPDPVTHINYFTPPSLSCLLERAGYAPIRCKLAWHRTRRKSLVVRAIAQQLNRVRREANVQAGSTIYTRCMLHRTLGATLEVAAADYTRAPVVLGYNLLRGFYRRIKPRVK